MGGDGLSSEHRRLFVWIRRGLLAALEQVDEVLDSDKGVGKSRGKNRRKKPRVFVADGREDE